MLISSGSPTRSLLTFGLLLCGLLFAAAPGWAGGQSTVSGTFKGNGKDTRLAHVSAAKGEPLAGKPTILLVFTEKDHSKDDRPQIKATFGGFGSALIVTIDESGDIVGCEVAHAAHEKQGFSSIGKVNLTDFKRTPGVIQGRLTTNGEVKTFGEKWELDLKFNAALPK